MEYIEHFESHLLSVLKNYTCGPAIANQESSNINTNKTIKLARKDYRTPGKLLG